MYSFSILISAFFKYSLNIFISYFFPKSKHDCFLLKYCKSPLLGPLYLKEYVYKFKNRTYNVILDTEKTSFEKFEREMKILKEPIIPNRALASKRIDVDMFNRYMGPLCDFHSKCNGVYVPYSVDKFLKRAANELVIKKKELTKNELTIIDTNGSKKYFDFMKKIKWLPSDRAQTLSFKNTTTTSSTNEKE